MKRIFISDIQQDHLKIDDYNIRYLKKTLRIKEKTEIIIFNGKKEYNAIFNPENNMAEIQSISTRKENLYLKLAVGEIKKERLEWLVEKATELGVIEIIILKTEYTQKYPNNLIRLQKITIEAAKQCNRISLPAIKYLNLSDFIIEINLEEWVIASLSNNNNLNTKKSGIIIGPEGGWSKQEEELFISKNINFINLGELVLRTETAAIVGLSKLIFC